jgi:hypothetical protein
MERMKKFHMVLGFAALTTIGGAALAHGAHGGRAWNADTNRDGKVTLDESLAVAKTHFEKRDANKDNVLTKEEIGPWGQRMLEKADTNKDGKLTVAERDASVRTLFTAKDTNKDGALSGDELRRGGPGGPDANRDGKVTLDESLAAAKTRFDARDANKDGALSKDEIGPRGRWMLEKADTNKDGKVTVAERDAGVRAMFTARDANKDGVLSGDELRLGHRRHAGKKAGTGQG